MSQVNKILVIKGKSQYGQMRCAMDEMIKGFLSKGCLVTILDLIHDEDEHIRLKLDFAKDYDLIFSMNLVGIDLYRDSICAEKAIFWSFLEDHPYHHHSRISMAEGKVLLSCCDRHHVMYIEKNYPHIPWTCFMPHGGIVGEAENKPFSERKYDVVFIGSLGKEDDILSAVNMLKNKYGSEIDSLIETILCNESLDIEDYIEQLIVQNDDLKNRSVYADVMSDFSVLDIYRRFLKRKKLLDTLADNGISVSIFGNGWDGLSDKTKSVHTLMGSIDHDKIGRIMGDSRYVLNDMPFFHDGTHDRVFAAMQCGAVCVTDSSSLFDELYMNMNEVVFYDTDRLDQLTHILKELFDNEDQAKEIAMQGFKAAREQTWKNRAKDIVEIAEGL